MISEERLDAAVRSLYPWYDGWPEDDQKIAQETVRQALEVSDAVMFSEENVNRGYPHVYGFLKRRGYTPIGKEVHVLIDYVVRGLKGDYGVE